MIENEVLGVDTSKLDGYNPLLKQALDLLKPMNKASLLHALNHCGITKDIEVNRITNDQSWEALTRQGRYLWMIVSKGNLFMSQDNWNQSTGPIASDNVIYNDTDANQHIMLAFNTNVQHAILRMLYLNAKKQVPILATLYGYEPYNIQDLTEEEYTKQRAEADAKAIIYAERYKDHIALLTGMSPYQAGNAFLILQANINLAIQRSLHMILSHGNVLTVENVVHYSFEPIADATRELFTKYHAEGTTEEEKQKVIRFIALYFSVVEEARNKAIAYIKSLNAKYGVIDEEVLNAI